MLGLWGKTRLNFKKKNLIEDTKLIRILANLGDICQSWETNSHCSFSSKKLFKHKPDIKYQVCH
jgi:hypothetical protein